MPNAADLIRQAIAHHQAAATLLTELVDGDKAGALDTDKLDVVRQVLEVTEKSASALRIARRKLAGLDV